MLYKKHISLLYHIYIYNIKRAYANYFIYKKSGKKLKIKLSKKIPHIYKTISNTNLKLSLI